MLLFMNITITILVLYVLQWLWLRVRRGKSKTRLPPFYPGRVPILGHALMLFGSGLHFWDLIMNVVQTTMSNGGVLRFQLGPSKHMSIVTDPEDCFLVGNTCLEKDDIYKFVDTLMANGLVTSPANIWKRHRKIISPAFSQQVIDGYVSAFNNYSRILVKQLETEVSKPFDHIPYLERTTIGITFRTTMGMEGFKDHTVNDFLDSVRDYLSKIAVYKLQNLWMLNKFLYSWTSVKRKEDAIVKVLHDIADEIIMKKKENLVNKESYPSRKFRSVLDILVEDGTFSDSEIRHEVITIIIGGYDTQSLAMTFTLPLIGSHPDVQEKIFDELEKVFDGSERDVTKEDLPKLTYLEAVIKESLRLYPVAPVVVRHLDHDVQLKNYTLPAGTSCVISLNGVCRSKVWGPDADEFKPERWLNGDVPKYAFGAFSFGKRNCIGQKFALMSMKTILCHILRNYRVHGDYTKMILQFAIMIKPASGHHITIEKRSKKELHI